jgi:hypothetical protein
MVIGKENGIVLIVIVFYPLVKEGLERGVDLMIEEIIVYGGLLLGVGTALWVLTTIIKPQMLKYEERFCDWLYGPDEGKK